MLYAVTDIIADVRAVLNSASRSVPLSDAFDPERAFFDDIIRRSLCAVVEHVHRHAPADRLEPGRSFNGAVGWLDKPAGGGFVVLPDDFMRLLAFRMADWSYAVTHAIAADTPLYRLQFSPYGVRGCPERPVVALVQRPAGLTLEFFTSTTDTMDIGQYVALPRIDEEGYIDISRSLHDAVVYRLAALTCESYGQQPHDLALAQTLRQRADRLL